MFVLCVMVVVVMVLMVIIIVRLLVKLFEYTKIEIESHCIIQKKKMDSHKNFVST